MSENKVYEYGQTVHGIVTGSSKEHIYLEVEEGVKAVIYAADCLAADENPRWFEDYCEGSDFSAQVKSVGKDKKDPNCILLTLSTKLAAEQAEREKREADRAARFEAIKAIKANDEIINAKVVGTNKGGVELKYNGSKLFLSYKQTELTEENFKELKGKDIPVLIVYIDEEKQRVSVSHTVALRKMKREEKAQAFDAINVDDVLEGKVVSLMQYGAIVELKDGLASGLLHISEMAHLPIKEVTKVVHIGDKVQVKVIEKTDKKLGLSLKALTTHPWELLKAQYHVNDVVDLKVEKLIPAGIILKLTAEYSGLMPKSEYSWNITEKYDGVVNEGDTLKVRILNIDDAKKRISLSHRALEANAWSDVKVRRGEKIEVKVTNIVERGAEVEYLGVVGFLPISEVSAEKRVTSVSEAFPIGTIVTVMVQDCDPNRQKLVVSAKEVELAKERETFEKYQNDEPKAQTIGDLIKFEDLDK